MSCDGKSALEWSEKLSRDPVLLEHELCWWWSGQLTPPTRFFGAITWRNLICRMDKWTHGWLEKSALWLQYLNYYVGVLKILLDEKRKCWNVRLSWRFTEPWKRVTLRCRELVLEQAQTLAPEKIWEGSWRAHLTPTQDYPYVCTYVHIRTYARMYSKRLINRRGPFFA